MFNPLFKKSLFKLLIFVFLSGALTACGVKSPPIPPDSANPADTDPPEPKPTQKAYE